MSTRHEAARLFFPVVRWDEEHGFSGADAEVERALELGVGGFIVFGGPAEAVRELTGGLRERSAHPILVGSDLERGAGQQFRGAVQLPPPAALGALDDPEVTTRAAELTAREARAVGVNWIYAPTADLDAEPRNPIVGTRAFAADAERVSRHVEAWIRGCRAGGALSCAKHFPGHGRTTADSHAELPVVDADRDTLAADLAPFVAAVEAGVPSIMTAHVAYPALDSARRPATLSRPIIQGLLREELGFDGLVVTDALIMAGVTEGSGEGTAAVRALEAGVDALLYPADLEASLEAVERAVDDGLPAERVDEAVARVERAAASVGAGPGRVWGAEEDVRWSLDVAGRSLEWYRGSAPELAGPVRLVSVDDDLGGPYAPPSREAFGRTLRAGGRDVEEVEVAARSRSGGRSEALTEVTTPAAGRDERALVAAVYADVRAWKGRPGLSEAAARHLSDLTASNARALVLFGHPRLVAELPGDVPVLCAWGGETLMQEAAGRTLIGRPSGPS